MQEVHDERLRRAGVRLLLKRDDLLDPEVPGNKWRKVLPNLAAARQAGHGAVLTFGGAYSNHLCATAAAGRRFGLRTVGIVRGEELRHRPRNAVLRAAEEYGMELDFLDRATWRRRMSPEVLDALHARYGPAYVVPEGGSNALGVRGCRAVTEELNAQTGGAVGVVCCAVGTGGTLAGLAAGLLPHQRAIGFAVLRAPSLSAEVAELQRAAFGRRVGEWRIETGYHFGGYARTTPELDAFRADFADRHGSRPEPPDSLAPQLPEYCLAPQLPPVRLHPVYEAKAVFGIWDLVASGAFDRGTTLAAVIAG